MALSLISTVNPSKGVSDVIQSVATVIVAVLGYMQGRRAGRVRGRHDAKDEALRRVEAALSRSRREHKECKDKLSAFETELVTLRKLLPGGEWAVKLRLYDDSDIANNVYERGADTDTDTASPTDDADSGGFFGEQ